MITGMLDDRFRLGVFVRIASEVLVALTIIELLDLRLTWLGDLVGTGQIQMPPTVSYIFTVVAMFGLMNAFNMLDGIDGLLTEFPVGMLVNYIPAGRQPQLQRQTAGHLLKETVQRADSHAVQLPGYLNQQLLCLLPGYVGRLHELRQLPTRLIIPSSAGQTQQYPLQNLTSGFSRERRRQNRFRWMSQKQLTQKVSGKLKRLSASGRRSNQFMHESDRTFRVLSG